MSGLFEGDRVRLRPFEPGDAAALLAYLNRPEMTGRRYVPWDFPDLAPLSRAQADAIVQKWLGADKGVRLAVVPAEADTLIGHIEGDWDWDPLCPSASVAIDPGYQRRGYGSEAMRLLLRYLFEWTPAHTVGCWIADWNDAGLQFSMRLGFQSQGRMRRVGVRQGRSFDVIVSDLLRSEWAARGR